MTITLINTRLTRRPFNKITSANNSNFTKKVNTVKGTRVNTARPKAVLSAVKGNKGNVVKASACWVWRPKPKVLDHSNPQQDLKDKGVIDSGCSRHMTGNRSYLRDYEEINGGFVAFGGNSKGGKITRKCKIRTGKLDFKDVYFLKELKFNLFSVSQICDKKNCVLFIDTECVVLSPDFKLTDESHVLLKVPRKDNMYIVDLKNVVPQGGLTCLFAKATPDESNLWHRRLGHVNFKTMNKLVRGNLVRGLPSKLFEINQTCVACQKGKQHRASCKTKTVSSISQPLQMLHMDLFGPTFVKSLMKKMYCLVVTDDFSRFSWVFFLATKDETSEILKTFITSIENLVDLKVKVIRCDNGTEFKNRVMNQLCEIKGIKREFGVARTPQQNGVAERKNRTLIEAARTMLADSKLPTTFWAEAVNTACYVQNRVLVPVTILNTIDHLGKFNGKADEVFFIGYSTNSKAFRVFNSRTRIVEDNLHVQFSMNTPNIAVSGPNWLFDNHALTKSMNYKPVVAGNQFNGNAGIKSCDDVGKARMETVPDKDYILLPIWPADPLFSQSSKDSPDAGFKPSGEEENKDAKDQGNEDSEVPSTEEPRVNQEKDDNVSSTNNVNTSSNGNNTNNVNAVSSIVNTAGIEVNVVDPKLSIELPDDLNMPELEDIVYSDDDDGGAEADMNNLNAFMPMDVKSAFLYGKIEEEVYVCQLPEFEDPDFPDRVYKRGKIDKTLFIRRDKGDILLVQVYVDDIIFGSTKKSLCTEFEKMMHKKFQMSSMGELTFFLGLQVKQKEDGIFISQDKYVTKILKKFGFSDVKTASTPMETRKPLLKDEDGVDVDEHLYRSMIGSLMYLTSSRPNIMFVVCACARYQVNPKVSHLHAVKRIFRYLKGQPKLDLWYLKDSPFDLVAYTDSDYAGARLDRKSTTEGCQFLGCWLISWQCKKQTVVANSTTEAEYIAASNCCGQVLWIHNQLLDYRYYFMQTKIQIDNESTICIVKNPVFHSKIKHIEIRHHFIRDSYEKKLIQMIKIYTDQNVADLLTKAFDVSRFQYLIASIGMLNL
ncbi:putative ribonuclease H-like domain-containing protein [Tanacetum coccineum]